MLKTEHQAQNTRCCRDQSDNCVTTQCMAWRWAEAPDRETMRLGTSTTEVNGTPVVRAGNARVVDGEHWMYSHTDMDKDGEFELLHRAPTSGAPTHGFCGLAGKP